MLPADWAITIELLGWFTRRLLTARYVAVTCQDVVGEKETDVSRLGTQGCITD